MSFDRPLVLLLGPLILLLAWWLRRLRLNRPRPVTAFLLLARASATLPPPPRRRALAWRQILRVLPALLALGALAGARLELRRAPPRTIAIVDRSASMATRTASGTRFDRALARLRQELADLELVPVPASTADPIEPSAAWVEPAMLLAEVEARRDSGAPLVVVTDKLLDSLPAGVGLVQAGDAEADGAIVALGLDERGRLLVRSAASAGAAPPSVEVLLEGGDPAAPKPIPLPAPAEPGRWLIEGVMPSERERVRARIAGADANPLDDEAVIVAARHPVRVGFPLAGYADLHRAFAALPDVELFRGDGECELRVGGLNSYPAGLSLLVAPSTSAGFYPGLPARQRGGLESPLPALAVAADDLDLPSLHVLDRLPERAEVLARIGGAPLLVRKDRVLLLLQSPEASEWPSRPSFPLFVAGIMAALDLRTPNRWSAHRGGERITFQRAGVRAVDLGDPRGGTRRLEAGPDGRFGFTVDQPGLYRARAVPEGAAPGDAWSREWSCAVLSEDAVRGPFAPSDSFRPPAITPPAPAKLSLEPWLAGLALLAFAAIELARSLFRAR